MKKTLQKEATLRRGAGRGVRQSDRPLPTAPARATAGRHEEKKGRAASRREALKLRERSAWFPGRPSAASEPNSGPLPSGSLDAPSPASPAPLPKALRSYQLPAFGARETGILILHWSRQIGKSYVLASWAVDRLLCKLDVNPAWLVTVLSNSRDNGAEFVLKAQDVCNRMGLAMQTVDESTNLAYENMRMEVRITVRDHRGPRTGRIKVLAANPRTARGFSGDLILDEFAFHENSNAIWEAAEPILSSNPEFLCRVASTGNGKHNMFFRMCNGPGPNDGTFFTSPAGFTVSRVTRTAAHGLGVKIYDQNTRQPITPAEARARALDKRAYDQNYECQFNDENMCLLTHELIQQAMRGGPPMDEQQWSAGTLARLAEAEGPLYLGQDVGRQRDLSVQMVIEKMGRTQRVVAVLRMAGVRLPQQQAELARIAKLPRFRNGCIDMTGLGLGLVEYCQEQPWGRTRIHGVHFSSTEPVNHFIRAEGRNAEKARVTENMATALLAAFEEKAVQFLVELDTNAIDDLRKPERITSPGGRTSIAAVRDEAGHADHFWALALAIRAGELGGAGVVYGRLPEMANGKTAANWNTAQKLFNNGVPV